MKKNNQNPEKKTLKKQLISGGVYIALSAVAVAVTVNTAVSMLSGQDELPPVAEQPNLENLQLPTAPENLFVPELSLPKTDSLSDFSNQNTPVSDSPSGISAEIIEDLSAYDKIADLPQNISDEDSPSALHNGFDVVEISSNANLGEDVFIKPCDGFVTVEHSLDIPVYSTTLGDYRTHCGVDIAADEGSLVKAVKGGVITKIYTDDLYGSCINLSTPDGYTFVYSNLHQNLSDGISEGMPVSTGTVLGCVGNSAIIESSRESHLHFEAMKDGQSIDPQDIISF